MTSIKQAVPVIFFLLVALTCAQTNTTGNTIITNLNTLSLAYQDLTQFALNLHKNLADDGQQLVEQYADITATQRQNENQPPPTEPVGETLQYRIAAASHTLVLEDRRFLTALAENYIYFGLLQRRRLVQLLRAQIQTVKKSGRNDAVLGPDVLEILQADDVILVASLKAAAAVFKAHSRKGHRSFSLRSSFLMWREEKQQYSRRE